MYCKVFVLNMILNFLLTWNFFFATIVILCNNVIYAIVGLVCLIVGSCCILFLLKIEFLSFILLLIYIGAILILFLFIVMMLQINSEELKKTKNFVLLKHNLLYVVLTLKTIFFFYFFNKKICISINLFSYEFIKLNDTINIFKNISLSTTNDAIIFLSLFSQKFYVWQI